MKNKILIILFILGLALNSIGTAFIVKGKCEYMTRKEGRRLLQIQGNALEVIGKVYKEYKIPLSQRQMTEDSNVLSETFKKTLFGRQILTGTIFLCVGLGLILTSMGIKFIFKN